jgi:hypothetical protein
MADRGPVRVAMQNEFRSLTLQNLFKGLQVLEPFAPDDKAPCRRVVQQYDAA